MHNYWELYNRNSYKNQSIPFGKHYLNFISFHLQSKNNVFKSNQRVIQNEINLCEKAKKADKNAKNIMRFLGLPEKCPVNAVSLLICCYYYHLPKLLIRLKFATASQRRSTSQNWQSSFLLLLVDQSV